jgi:hypothetical protein
LPEDETRGDVFGLLEPQPAAEGSVAADAIPAAHAREIPPRAGRLGREQHAIEISDLSRLSIDKQGRLYWDGKPVEVRRRILMSRPQVVAASIVAVFVVIGAVGAAIHGSTAALDWACRLGWTKSYCTLPDAVPPAPPQFDIPA